MIDHRALCVGLYFELMGEQRILPELEHIAASWNPITIVVFPLQIPHFDYRFQLNSTISQSYIIEAISFRYQL